MLLLRPHHLLCMQNFVGKGYSEAFTGNMKSIKALYDADAAFELWLGPDSVCAACPNIGMDSRCKDQEKVERFDRAVLALLAAADAGENFRIMPKENREAGPEPRMEGAGPSYSIFTKSEILPILKSRLTEQSFAEICGDCEWARKGICRFDTMKL